MTPTTSPGATVSETSSSAVRPPKRTVRPSTCSIRAGSCAGGGASSSLCAKVRRARLCRTHNGRGGRRSDERHVGRRAARGAAPRSWLGVDGHLEDVVGAAVDAIRADIPVYGDASPALAEDVRDHVRAHYVTKVACLRRRARGHRSSDLAFARGPATRRARAGLGLEDFINAFRVGHRCSGTRCWTAPARAPAGREAALTLATPLMRYCEVGEHPGRPRLHRDPAPAVADADRDRRELLEQLLAGEFPAHGPLHAARAELRARAGRAPAGRGRGPRRRRGRRRPRPAPRWPARRSAPRARSRSPSAGRGRRGRRPVAGLRLTPGVRAHRSAPRAPARGGRPARDRRQPARERRAPSSRARSPRRAPRWSASTATAVSPRCR